MNLYFESQRTEHPTAVSWTTVRFVAVDDTLAGRPGARYFGADLVDAPTAATVRLALYPLKFAGLIVASRDELLRTPGAEGPRPPHSRQLQLLASGQLACDAAETARSLAATFFRALTLIVILAGRCPRWTHVLFNEGRTLTGDSQQRLCKLCDS